MAFVTSVPNKITTDEVEFGASISEEQATKVAAAINFVIDKWERLNFGVWGANYDTLVSYPYIFADTKEILKHNYNLTLIEVVSEVCGTSGSNVFKIERQIGGIGSWSEVYSLEINSSASNNLSFKGTDTVSGVTQSTSITSFSAGDVLRFKINSVAVNPKNIKITLYLSPTE